MPKFKRVARKADGGGLGSTPMRFPDQEPKTREEQSAGLFNRGITGLARSLIYAMGGDPNLPANDSSGSSLSGLPTGNLPLLTSGMRSSLPTAVSQPTKAVTTARQALMPPKRAPIPKPGSSVGANFLDRDMEAFAKMTAANPELMKTMALGLPGLPTSSKGGEGEEQELESLKKTGGASSAAAAIPKTKAGMKKFMQDYGKFIALGAMAGAGGKGGQIAAPIIAALPGLIEMMKGKGKAAAAPVEKKSKGGFMKNGPKRFADGGETKDGKSGKQWRSLQNEDILEFLKPIREDSVSRSLLKKGELSYRPFGDPQERIDYVNMRNALAQMVDEMYHEKNKMPAQSGRAMVSDVYTERGTKGFPYNSKEFRESQERHLDSGKKKSSEGEPPKKSEGGAIRKFKGGSMKGNTKDSMLTPKYKKGGSIGEISQHKKMAMGKPTPQSTGQKFAKGGTMKCATGGGVKGYGIAKKIRPTGPMN